MVNKTSKFKDKLKNSAMPSYWHLRQGGKSMTVILSLKFWHFCSWIFCINFDFQKTLNWNIYLNYQVFWHPLKCLQLRWVPLSPYPCPRPAHGCQGATGGTGTFFDLPYSRHGSKPGKECGCSFCLEHKSVLPPSILPGHQVSVQISLLTTGLGIPPPTPVATYTYSYFIRILTTVSCNSFVCILPWLQSRMTWVLGYSPKHASDTQWGAWHIRLSVSICWMNGMEAMP